MRSVPKSLQSLKHTLESRIRTMELIVPHLKLSYPARYAGGITRARKDADVLVYGTREERRALLDALERENPEAITELVKRLRAVPRLFEDEATLDSAA